jgi:hypothetical protein
MSTRCYPEDFVPPLAHLMLGLQLHEHLMLCDQVQLELDKWPSFLHVASFVSFGLKRPSWTSGLFFWRARPSELCTSMCLPVSS